MNILPDDHRVEYVTEFFISNSLLYSDFWLLSPHKILILHQFYFQFVVKLSVVVLS